MSATGRISRLAPAGACLALGLALAVAAHATDYPGNNGTFTADRGTIPHDYMWIAYMPDPAKVGKCDSIHLIQTVRARDGAGKLLEPGSLKPKGAKTGDLSSMQDDMTDGGTAVDHVASEKDPYYNGYDTVKDRLSRGSSGGPTPGMTLMTDEPWIPDSWMPDDVNTVNLEFETCAICKTTGVVLDCVKWSYTRNRGDQSNGTVAEPTAPNAGPPSEEFKAAKAKFEKNHEDDQKCPEEVAENHLGEQNATAGYCQYLPPFPHPLQPTQLRVDVVNSSGQPMNSIPWTAFDLGGTRFLASGTVPFLEPFSFAAVTFGVPPVVNPADVDLVLFTVDPAGAIPEFDETDNGDTIPVGYFGPVGVGDGPGGSAADPLRAWPNPFRGRASLSFTLPQACQVDGEVFDAAGALVRRLHSGSLAAGAHALQWDARDLSGRRAPAGTYLVRVRTEGRTLTAKVVLLR